MKTKLFLLATAVACASLAQAQPRITNVTNAASYVAAGLPGAGIAQGSIFVVFGTNMGPATLIQAGAPRPTAAGLSGTRVRITAGAANFDAPMIYTSAGQVAAIMPSNVPVGPASVIVLFNDQASSPFPVAVVRFALGIFTLNSAGTGPGVVTDANYSPVTFTTAMNPGQVGIIWANGLGAVTPAEDISGAITGAVLNPVQVEVFIAGKPATVLYSGRAPGFTGLDQINFTMPDVEGCAVPIAIRLNGGNGLVSNFVSTSVARNGRVCRDRGFTEADLQSAANGTVRFGVLSFSRSSQNQDIPGLGPTIITTDVGSGNFFRFDYNTLIRSSSVAQPPAGACTVSTFGGQNAPTDPALALITPLDAGGSLAVTGPKGAKTLARTLPGNYSATLGGGGIPGLPSIPGVPAAQPEYLDPGQYTVTGTGGADVGAFTAQLTMPQPVTWTNAASIANVARNQNLLITWTGGVADDFVIVSGSSFQTTPQAGGFLIFYERAGAGQLTVTYWVLSTLPISATISGVGTGQLSVGSASSNPPRFTASGIDIGVFSYSSSTGKGVNYQ